MKTVLLNGETQHTDADSVLELLENLQMTRARFAVEIDGELVPKTQLANTALMDNMRIEVVQAVGGG